MKLTGFIIVLLSSLLGHAQYKVSVIVFNNEEPEYLNYQVKLSQEGRVLLETNIDEDSESELTTLPNGDHYVLEIAPMDSVSITKHQLVEFSIDSADVFIEINFENNLTQETESERPHEQSIFGHFMNNKWFDQTAALTLSTGIGFSTCDYSKWTNNLDAAINFGANLTHESFATDTTFSAFNGLTKRYENYTYFGLFIEPKIRLHGRQLASKTNGYKGPMFDLGVKYQLPLLFQHRTLYPNKETVVEKRIHNFSDLRFTAVFGIQNFAVYANYRLFQLVEKTTLPDPTPWQFGLMYRTIF